jgi:hypothetical protein
MEGLSVHDHVCLIYESQEEQFAAVVPFMQHGLAAGQACMYIADDNTAGAVGAALRSDGIDTDAESARGALRDPHQTRVLPSRRTLRPRRDDRLPGRGDR